MYVVPAPGGVDTVDAIGLVMARVIDLGARAVDGGAGRDRSTLQTY